MQGGIWLNNMKSFLFLCYAYFRSAKFRCKEVQDHSAVLWDAKTCSFAKRYRRLGGTFYLSLQDGTVTFYRRLYNVAEHLFIRENDCWCQLCAVHYLPSYEFI